MIRIHGLSVYEMLNRIPVAFIAVDMTWKFTYTNTEATRLLLRSQEDLVGKCIWDEFPEAVHLAFYDQYLMAMREQVTVEFDAYFPPLGTWFDIKAYPSPYGLSVYFQDITEKKRITIQKDQHYESLFKNNPDAVFYLDLDGNYLSVNSAGEQLIGYREDELRQLSFISLITSGYLDMTMRSFSEATRGVSQNYETRTIHKKGHIIDVKVTNMPIIVNQEVVGVYVVARDISKENKNEKKLFETEKLTAVGQLAASIAHEIRNPLTSLKGFLQLIQTIMPEVKKEYFEIMLDELARIDMISSELLILAKPQANELRYENVGKIITDVALQLRSQALINKVEIKTFNLESLPQIQCIGAQVKQVFINLIKNSVEAMPGGGAIRVVGKQSNLNLIMIQVIDEGCGIPKAFLNQIGNPFYTTKEKGTGLGMMVTLKIIHAHGGSIDISSVEGKGTTIDIYLPVDLPIQ
ncbi:PAS domain S-box protein [Paenibacillus sp. LjRoot153]|uniref:PAS domain S-box protein n=1 Tax=Paenibacillus sp. LjRoot153 TaxID=3342270 RepID=UPI003ECD782B